MDEVVKDRLFSLAEQYVEETGVSVFLTGKAGTGKTTFLRYIVERTAKRAVVLAPTGVAAVNARGSTIHSFFSLPLCPYLPDVPELKTEYQMPEQYRRLRKEKIQILKTLDLLVIDEISMVRADLLDAVDMMLRRYRRSEKPFGGVQLLMIGDAQQLSPVVTEAERPYLARVYPSPYFFHARALQRLQYVTIELQAIYRQEDAAFIAILNGVRDQRLTPSMRAMLQARVGAPAGKDWIRLTTHNAQADRINADRLAALPGKEHVLQAQVDGDYPESLFPAAYELTLKEGARVMFIRNDREGRFYNGKMATVERIQEELVTVYDDEGEEIALERAEWENLQYRLEEATGEIVQECKGTFRQFPLRPAWAITVHKSQGLTFDHVVVDVGAAFAYGQVYVALSRCRSLEGLSLTGPVSPSLLLSDADVAAFHAGFPAPGAVERDFPVWRDRFSLELRLSCFDFSSLRTQLLTLRKLWREHLTSTYPTQAETLEAEVRQVSENEAVAARFRSQLTRVFGDVRLVEERTRKAASYFLPRMEALSLRTLFSVEVDNTEVRKRLKNLAADMLPQWRMHVDMLGDIVANGFEPHRCRQIRSQALLGEAVPAKGRKKSSALAGQMPAGTSKASVVASAQTSEVATHDVYKDNRHPERVAALIAWRKEKAAEQGVPAFHILQQKTLLHLADALPSTREEFLSVPGFGPVLWKKYGGELMELLAAGEEDPPLADGNSRKVTVIGGADGQANGAGGGADGANQFLGEGPAPRESVER